MKLAVEEQVIEHKLSLRQAADNNDVKYETFSKKLGKRKKIRSENSTSSLNLILEEFSIMSKN